jgi:hypothetical protein
MPVPPNSPVPSMQPLTVVRLRQDLQRGTIVQELDENTVLVKFADEHGETLELVPVPKVLLMCEKSLVETLAAMPDVGDDDDFCCRRVGVSKGQFELTDNEPASIFPIDAAWENMEEVGLEIWPDGEEEHNEK